MIGGLRPVQLKGFAVESARFQHASDPSSFEALIAFDPMARAARGCRRLGRVYSLQQHSGGEKEGRQLQLSQNGSERFGSEIKIDRGPVSRHPTKRNRDRVSKRILGQ